MNKTIVRNLTSTSKILAPRFTKTLTEASKPPLEKSIIISRPFGLESPRLLNQRTNAFANFNIFSSEAKERRQKALDHDIKHSPFYDSKSFNNTNGKIFLPPKSYFKNDHSKYFPDFIGDSLVKKDQKLSNFLKNKVNIIRVYSTLSGEKCTDTYFNVENENYLTTGFKTFQNKFPHSQIIDINIPQNWLKASLVKLSRGNIKKSIPVERVNSYFILPDHVLPYDVKQTLYCDNSCSGYVYIVDHNGKIRWATSGYSNNEELKVMWKCVNGLEKEVEHEIDA